MPDKPSSSLWVGDVPIELVRKRIHHLHLYVKPPDGRVFMTAPVETSAESALLFVRENFAWVLRQREGMRRQSRQAPREYVSGETHYLWGRQLFLTVVKQKVWGEMVLSGNQLTMFAPEKSTVRSTIREGFEASKSLFNIKLPALERLTGLSCANWQIRDMARQWGSCNPEKASIQLNLQLAQKEKVALRYVILHELCHLKVRSHGREFMSLLDRFMPDWRDVRKRLNDAPVAYVEERSTDSTAPHISAGK